MPTHYAWCVKQKLVKTDSVVTTLATLFVWTHVGLGRQNTRTVVLIQRRIGHLCGGQSQEKQSPYSIHVNHHKENIYRYLIEIKYIVGVFFFKVSCNQVLLTGIYYIAHIDYLWLIEDKYCSVHCGKD